jgi:hypothetical protein
LFKKQYLIWLSAQFALSTNVMMKESIMKNMMTAQMRQMAKTDVSRTQQRRHTSG